MSGSASAPAWLRRTTRAVRVEPLRPNAVTSATIPGQLVCWLARAPAGAAAAGDAVPACGAGVAAGGGAVAGGGGVGVVVTGGAVTGAGVVLAELGCWPSGSRALQPAVTTRSTAMAN